MKIQLNNTIAFGTRSITLAEKRPVDHANYVLTDCSISQELPLWGEALKPEVERVADIFNRAQHRPSSILIQDAEDILALAHRNRVNTQGMNSRAIRNVRPVFTLGPNRYEVNEYPFWVGVRRKSTMPGLTAPEHLALDMEKAFWRYYDYLLQGKDRTNLTKTDVEQAHKSWVAKLNKIEAKKGFRDVEPEMFGLGSRRTLWVRIFKLPSKDTVTLGNLVEPNTGNIYGAPHTELDKWNQFKNLTLRRIFQARKTDKPDQVQNGFADLVWANAQQEPFMRGTAAITGLTQEALTSGIGVKISPLKPGIHLNAEATMMTRGGFRKRFPKLFVTPPLVTPRVTKVYTTKAKKT